MSVGQLPPNQYGVAIRQGEADVNIAALWNERKLIPQGHAFESGPVQSLSIPMATVSPIIRVKSLPAYHEAQNHKTRVVDGMPGPNPRR